MLLYLDILQRLQGWLDALEKTGPDPPIHRMVAWNLILRLTSAAACQRRGLVSSDSLLGGKHQL